MKVGIIIQIISLNIQCTDMMPLKCRVSFATGYCDLFHILPVLIIKLINLACKICQYRLTPPIIGILNLILINVNTSIMNIYYAIILHNIIFLAICIVHA